jgi:thiosulfate dehydrogenase
MKAQLRDEAEFIRRVQQVFLSILVSVSFLLGSLAFLVYQSFKGARVDRAQAIALETKADPGIWQAPDSTLIPVSPDGDVIRYGRALISHTAKYLGPKGKVRRMSNGMNCQNCHLEAGTKPFGNNYAAVASTYPKFRGRSGVIETIEKRVNDCIERSLNGKTLSENSVEMGAIIAYFRWLGKDVKKGTRPPGTGISALPFLDRPADPVKGKMVYTKHCVLCHREAGTGFKSPDSAEWKYPPLAGPSSYNTGAGLFRLSKFAGYVKSNMPKGTTYENPVLSDEEAWDVAAYVNSLPRPEKRFAGDWPDVSKKPYDHPFGPYADTFSELQHKYGPFDVIRDVAKKEVGMVPSGANRNIPANRGNR